MPFAKHIASLGFTALAFDFPGPFGLSDGEFSYDKPGFFVDAVIGFLQERGYERVVCMGGSLGGDGCYKAALLRPNMAGMVILSSPFPITPEEAAILIMPKLFISGDEPDVTPLMKDTFQLLPEPKQFETFLVKAHGTDIFSTDSGEELTDLLVEFLESIQ
jgi:esterase/lipase